MNFGIIFAALCLILGVLAIIFWQPFWYLLKKEAAPDHLKWCLRIPGILLILLGVGILAVSVIDLVRFS